MLDKIILQVKLVIYTLKLIIKNSQSTFIIIIIIILAILNGIFPLISLRLTQTIINLIQTFEGAFSGIVNLLIIYLVFSLFTILIQNIFSYFMSKFNIILTYNISYLFMKKCSELSLTDLEDTETYDKISRLENEISIKPFQIIQSLISLCSGSITFIGAIIIIFSWKNWLAITIIITALIFFIYYLRIADKEFQIMFKRSSNERKSWYYRYLLTHDTAYKEVKILNLKDYFLDKYYKLGRKFINEDNKINRLRMFFSIFMLSIQEILGVLIMFIAIKEAYNGKILMGTTITYITLISTIQSSISTFADNIYSIYNSNLYISLLREFLSLNSTKKVSCEYKIKEIETIEIKNLFFNYPHQKNVLKNITFDIKKGEKVAIVGKNGSGKSTLLKLLCKLYECPNETIMINGVDINDIDVNAYNSQISVLFQDFLKFEGSLLENIHIGNIEKEINIENIDKALYSANVEFLKENNQYLYNLIIGNWFDNGSQLSGGQWQKIALARVYYKNASAFFLDEPSSALDVIAETQIFDNFFLNNSSKIGIYITHRVKIAMRADKIIVLDNGEIVGIGDHNFLYNNCDLYKSLFIKEEQIY